MIGFFGLFMLDFSSFALNNSLSTKFKILNVNMICHVSLFFFFWKNFQLMTSASVDSSLSLDKDINWFLV